MIVLYGKYKVINKSSYVSNHTPTFITLGIFFDLYNNTVVHLIRYLYDVCIWFLIIFCIILKHNV